MNLLHIISAAASGGAEVYVKDLAKFLSKQGHTLHIAFLSTAADTGKNLVYEEDFSNDLKSSRGCIKFKTVINSAIYSCTYSVSGN